MCNSFCKSEDALHVCVLVLAQGCAVCMDGLRNHGPLGLDMLKAPPKIISDTFHPHVRIHLESRVCFAYEPSTLAALSIVTPLAHMHIF